MGHLRPVVCHLESSGQRMLIFRVLGNQNTFYFDLLQTSDPRIPLKFSCWQLIWCLACNQCSRNILLIELSFKMFLSPVCLPHYFHQGLFQYLQIKILLAVKIQVTIDHIVNIRSVTLPSSILILLFGLIQLVW